MERMERWKRPWAVVLCEETQNLKNTVYPIALLRDPRRVILMLNVEDMCRGGKDRRDFLARGYIPRG